MTDNDNEKRPSEQTSKQKELTFQKLLNVDHKSVSDKNICDEKERTNETENNVSSHNATQNFVNHGELESEKIVTEETRNSSKEISDESSNILNNKLDSSIINSDINHEIPICSQQVLETDVNNQLNNISKNSSPNHESDTSDNVNQMNNLTSTNNKSDTADSENKTSNFNSNLLTNDNSEKNLQSEEPSSVIATDTDMATSNVVTNDVLSNANHNNCDEIRKIEGITQDSVKFLAPNMLQTNNSSYIITTPGIQSASTIQMNSSNNVVPLQVPQPTTQANAVLEVPLPTLPAIFVPTLGPDGTVQGNLYRFIINTPVFSPSPGCGIGVPLSTVPAQNVASPVTSTPTAPVINIGNKGPIVKKPEESFIAPLESE